MVYRTNEVYIGSDIKLFLNIFNPFFCALSPGSSLRKWRNRKNARGLQHTFNKRKKKEQIWRQIQDSGRRKKNIAEISSLETQNTQRRMQMHNEKEDNWMEPQKTGTGLRSQSFLEFQAWYCGFESGRKKSCERI